MFDNFLKWRKANNVDLIHEVEFPEIEEVRKIFPHAYHNTDKQGRPLYIESLSNLKYTDMLKENEES